MNKNNPLSDGEKAVWAAAYVAEIRAGEARYRAMLREEDPRTDPYDTVKNIATDAALYAYDTVVEMRDSLKRLEGDNLVANMQRDMHHVL